MNQKQSWEETLEKIIRGILSRYEDKFNFDFKAAERSWGKKAGMENFLREEFSSAIKQAIQTREREVREEYENNKHFVLPPAIQVDLSDMEMIKCCDIAVARREREISEEVGKKSSNGVVDSHAWIFVKEVLSIINNK
mgnify:FL=1